MEKEKFLGLSAALSFLVAIYIFGYAITYNDTDFLSVLKDNDGNNIKDYSISFSLANGNAVGLTIFLTL